MTSESRTERPSVTKLRRKLAGSPESDSTLRNLVGVVLTSYVPPLLFFAVLGYRHLAQHKSVSYLTVCFGLIWLYGAAIFAMSALMWPSVQSLIAWVKQGYPDALEAKMLRDAIVVRLLREYTPKVLRNLEQRLSLEVKSLKLLTDGLGVLATALAAALAASVAVANKKLPLTKLLIRLELPIFVLFLVTILAILKVTGDKRVYLRLAWLARRALSGQPDLLKETSRDS